MNKRPLEAFHSYVFILCSFLCLPHVILGLVFRFIVHSPQDPSLMIKYALDIMNTDPFFIKTWKAFSNNASWLFIPSLISCISFIISGYISDFLYKDANAITNKTHTKGSLVLFILRISLIVISIIYSIYIISHNALQSAIDIYNGDNIFRTIKLFFSSKHSAISSNGENLFFFIYCFPIFNLLFLSSLPVQRYSKSIILTILKQIILSFFLLVFITIFVCSSYLVISYFVQTLFISILMFIMFGIIIALLAPIGAIGMGVATAAFTRGTGSVGISSLNADEASDRVALHILSYDEGIEGIQASDKLSEWSKKHND